MRKAKGESLYEFFFRRLLNEGVGSVWTDRLGGKVKVRQGARFLQGKNGKGVSVDPDARAFEDDTGQMVEVSHDARFMQGDDGKGIAVPKGKQATMQPNGSLKIRHAPKKVPPRGSMLESMIRIKELARRFGFKS